MRLIAFAIGLSMVVANSHATVFIDAPVEIKWFYDFADSPYVHAPRYSFDEKQVSIDCPGVASQADRVKGFSVAQQQALEQKSKALAENDRPRADALELKAVALYRSMVAAGGVLSVLASRPIKARRGVYPSDPFSAFLIDASLNKINSRSWLDSVRLESIQSSLPVRVWKPLKKSLDSFNWFEFVDAHFSSVIAPDVGPWRLSLGRKRSGHPLELGVGWNPYWLHCDSPGQISDNRCIEPELGLTLDLTQGQYCAALSGPEGALVTLNIEYLSPAFGNQSASVTLRIGYVLNESDAQAKARAEGNNRAMDFLVRELIKDVFGISQLYRVSDTLLKPFDGGAYKVGETIEGTAFDGTSLRLPSVTLRDALNTVNGALAAANDVPSESEIIAFLAVQDRYKGARRKVRDKFEAFAEFTLRRSSGDIVLGFVVSEDAVNVGYVLRKGTPIYMHPMFFCSHPGLTCL